MTAAAAAATGAVPAAGGSKKATTGGAACVRGGGGICPAKSHAKYFSVNLAEAQDLGRVAEGKKRNLTKIPDNYRLEVTGLRIVEKNEKNEKKPVAASTTKEQQQQVVYATIGTVPKKGTSSTTNKPTSSSSFDLEKRTKPEWNGLHVNIVDENQELVVQVFRLRDKKENESSESSKWELYVQTKINPLDAFVYENQDVVWHPTDVVDDKYYTVWVELSMVRKTSHLRSLLKSAGLTVKKRKKLVYKFEPRRRNPEEIQIDNDMLMKLVKEKDDSPMTLQDKVFMKDIWNKCLGWIDMTGEFIVDGLFLRCPDLYEILGKMTAELMFEMLVGMIDKAIRTLDVRTEVVAREAYHEMPLSAPEDKPFKTLDEAFLQFAQLGMRPRHWNETRTIFLLAMQKANPYLEETDMEILETGVDSCAFKFWNQHVMLPALLAIKELDDVFESEENRATLQKMMKPVLENKTEVGIQFYTLLLSEKPELLPYFGRTDMNYLAGHLFEAVALLIESFNDFESALPVLNQLGKIHDFVKIPVWTYPAIAEILDILMRNVEGYDDEVAKKIWQMLIDRVILVTSRISFVSERLLRKAFEWTEQVAYELKLGEAWLAKRKVDIESEIRSHGTYSHTEEEVVHGARVSWRNSAKCVGRIAWNTMLVRDRRHVTDLDQMFAECIEHQRLATADGSLKAVMTVFQPRKPGTRLGMRFWGQQLIRFACYEMPDGSLMGDKANVQYTKEVIEFGWSPPEPRTEFDVLPLVIEDTVTGLTKMFEVPKEYHKVTMIEHPKFPDLAKLGLRWCVVPTVTCFTLKLGGLEYTCCPFNGWFMECEITRDLLEPCRMDKLEAIARAIGVDSSDEDDFWRERVAHETNKAVVYSFRRDGHSIVDHVTAQAQFLAHDLREKREGREVPAQWSWVVPSSGGSTMPIWHHEMRDFYIEPQYLYQAEVTALRAFSTVPEEKLLSAASGASSSFEKLLILFGSVTGTAEGYAYRAKKMLRPLHVDVKGCDKVEVKTLWKEFVSNGGPYSALLVITSTFGEGDPPTNAAPFFETLKTLPVSALSGIKYSVMAIGSRVYPDYCKAGIDLDYWFRQTGAEQLLPLSKADELENQPATVEQWILSIGGIFNLEQKKALVLSGDLPAAEEAEDDGPPVKVTILSDDHDKVKLALGQEEKLSDMTEATGSTAGALGRFLPDGYNLCQVTRNTELVDFSKPGSKEAYKSTRFLEFDLNGVTKTGEPSTLAYATGDHAKIMPCNSPEVVSAMCTCLQVQPETWVEVEVQEGMGRPLTVSVARIADILSMELDLATQDKDGNLPLFEKLKQVGGVLNTTNSENIDPQKKGLLQNELDRLEATIDSLLGVTIDVEEKETAGVDTRKQAITNIMENYMDIPSVLQEYPTLTSMLSLADCIEVLPRTKPRHYSIASATELYPTRLQLTVGVLTVNHKTSKKVRKGICSNYLAASESSGEGNKELSNFIRLGINTSSFRLPPDMSYPVIMVGPGTGISPMMGFLQAREKAKNDGLSLGPCMVFFGCRTEDDFLHSEQMRSWENSGVITSLQVAFSRLPGQPKEYVQHRISKIRGDVWGLLSVETCHYYICGDSNMAEDVYDELFQTAKATGGLSHSEAFKFFVKMKDERRFQADTWGVVMKRKEGLEKQAEKKRNQAAVWLKSVAGTEESGIDNGSAVSSPQESRESKGAPIEI